MRELPERSADSITYEVAVLPTTPRSETLSETRRLLEAVREECGRKRETRANSDAKDDAMVELRRTHAERRKKLAECAEALAARDQEIDRARKEQQEEEKKKAAASEEFFMRWLNDAEDQLRNVREELSQEQELSTQLQEQLRSEASAHAEALARRDADMAAEIAEAARQRAGVEEALQKVANTERDLEAARVEFGDERSLVAKALAAEAAEAGRQRAGAEDASRRLANAERDLEAARGELGVERTLATEVLAQREAELATEVAEAGRQRAEVENALRRLADAEHGLQATRTELGEERRLVAQAKADSERTWAELSQTRARELSRVAAERSAELERHSAMSEAERSRAAAEEQWQRRLADAEEALQAVRDELVREQRLAARIEATGERTLTEICQSHADELSRKAVDHSEALARCKQEAMEAQRGQEEADRRVAEADLRWRRSLAEAETGLQAAKEELRRERQLAAATQDSGESTLTELRQALAGERVRSASARAEAEALAFERDAGAEAERARRDAQTAREAAQASEILERAAQAQRAERERLAAEVTWRRRLGDVEAVSFRTAQEAEEAKQSESRAEEALYVARTELEQERRLVAEEQRRNRALGEGAKSLQRRDEELDIARREAAGAVAEAGVANATAVGLRREAEEARRGREAAERQGAEAERHWQGRLARAGEELRSAREELQAARTAPTASSLSVAPAAEDHLSRKLLDCTKALAQREAELEQLRRDAKMERQQVSMQRAEADEGWLRRLAAAESRGADEGRAEGRRAAASLRQVHADELAYSAHFGMEAERHMEAVEEQWQRRLSILEEDLEAAREELRHERGLASQAQADGERAVLRTIQGFWQARVESKEASPTSVPASAGTPVTARFCMETPRPDVMDLPVFGSERLGSASLVGPGRYVGSH